MSNELEYYPMRGYIYTHDGYHDGGEYLENVEQLTDFLTTKVPPALHNKVEIRITDCWDNMLFWAQKGQILFPPKEPGDND